MMRRVRITTKDGRKYEGDVQRFGRHWEGSTSKAAVMLQRALYYDPILVEMAVKKYVMRRCKSAAAGLQYCVVVKSLQVS